MHVMQVQTFLEQGDLVVDGDIDSPFQILRSNCFFQAIVATVKTALPPACQVEDGFAQRFAGNGARVNRDTPGSRSLIDQHDRSPQSRRLGGSVQARGPAADYQKVVFFHRMSGPICSFQFSTCASNRSGAGLHWQP